MYNILSSQLMAVNLWFSVSLQLLKIVILLKVQYFAIFLRRCWQECCHCCRLATIRIQMGLSCHVMPSMPFSSYCRSAYNKCCIAAAQNGNAPSDQEAMAYDLYDDTLNHSVLQTSTLATLLSNRSVDIWRGLLVFASRLFNELHCNVGLY